MCPLFLRRGSGAFLRTPSKKWHSLHLSKKKVLIEIYSSWGETRTCPDITVE